MDRAARQDTAPAAAQALAPDAGVDGLRWHADRWWWTDPDSVALYLWSPGSAPLRSRLPDSVSAFAFCRSGRVLLAQAKWLCFADLAAPPLQGLGRRPPQPAMAVDPAEPRTAISDGSTDRAGNFVFGTGTAAGTPGAASPGSAAGTAGFAPAIGSFYQYSARHGLRRLALPTVAAANSICFSPDGRIMYFSDAATRRIQQCDYDAEAARVANVRLFADAQDARPRGAAVDSAGCVWSAQALDADGHCRVVRYAPDGAALRSELLPAAQPTRPAFGGPGLEQLMVGSAAGLHLMDGAGASGLACTLFNDIKE